jgi:LPS sulfotransferase NodH
MTVSSAEYAPPRASYLVCASQRTGSTLLCDALADTNLLGRPREYFWDGDERLWSSRWKAERLLMEDGYAAYLSAVLRAGTTDSGIFGAKLMWNHAEDFLGKLAATRELAGTAKPDLLHAVFPGLRAVHLVRRDKIAAAVSQWRAEVSGRWRDDGDGGTYLGPPPPLDVIRVTVLHEYQHAAEAGWPRLLRAARVPFCQVSYDEIVTDREGSVRRIAAFVDEATELPLPLPSPRTRRQSDRATSGYVSSWVDATGGCVACGSVNAAASSP